MLTSATLSTRHMNYVRESSPRMNVPFGYKLADHCLSNIVSTTKASSQYSEWIQLRARHVQDAELLVRLGRRYTICMQGATDFSCMLRYLLVDVDIRLRLSILIQGIGHTEGRTQRYEEVPQKLMQAVQIWHRDDPKLEFVLSLGDIIDGRSTQVGVSPT